MKRCLACESGGPRPARRAILKVRPASRGGCALSKRVVPQAGRGRSHGLLGRANVLLKSRGDRRIQIPKATAGTRLVVD
jgi:hypothetical protein